MAKLCFEEPVMTEVSFANAKVNATNTNVSVIDIIVFVTNTNAFVMNVNAFMTNANAFVIFAIVSTTMTHFP